MTQERMYALSLWRPWSWTFFHGGKRVENRPWPLPGWAKDVPIAMHAAQRFDQIALRNMRHGRFGEAGKAVPATGHPTGIVGVLSNIGQQEEFQVLSLWAAVPYYISIPNPKAVHAMLSKLKEVYDFSIDLSSLEADANSFDNEINNIVAKDPNVAAYVRELKKRDFLN